VVFGGSGKQNGEVMEEDFLEITLNVDGKTFKAIDYGWEDDTFVAVDKETGIEYRFNGAWVSGYKEVL